MKTENNIITFTKLNNENKTLEAKQIAKAIENAKEALQKQLEIGLIDSNEVQRQEQAMTKKFLESVKKGDVKEITFTQKLDLQGGEYLLSLGVTGYEGDKFQVYHRLYDVLSLTVVAEKNTVGYYDMNSKVVVK